MGRSLGRVALLLLGAVLLGTVGLAVGSWYGGRGAAPLSPDQSRSVAAGLLPGARSTGGSFMHAYRYRFLAADDFGARRAEFWYGPRVDCALSDQLRRNAASAGWQGLRRVSGDPCDGWRAEKNGLTATLTHRASGSMLRISPSAPDGFLAATAIGTLLGAAAGATLFWLVARRRLPAPWLIGTVVTVGLFPGVALTWMDLATDGLAEPVWPIWPALVPLLVPVCLVILFVGVIVLAGPRKPTGPATEATAAGREPAIR